MDTTFPPAFTPAVLLAYKASPHPKIQPKQCCWGKGALCQGPAATLRRCQGTDEITLPPQSHPTAKKAKQHFQETFQTL